MRKLFSPLWLSSPRLWLILSVFAVAAAGCATKPRESNLPTYGGVDAPTALRILDERAKSVTTVAAEAGLTLTRADGQTVRLEGAVAMAPPDRLRLRAWKFGQAVFDLTLTPDGLWLVTPDDPSRRQKVLPASLSAAQLGREWALLSGSFFGDAGLKVRESGKQLVVTKALEGGRTVVCDVDRRTLTPRRYRMTDPAGHTRFTLKLSEYGVFNGTLWPTRLEADRGDGRIGIRLKNVELNGELAPNAFKPPRRAEKQAAPPVAPGAADVQ